MKRVVDVHWKEELGLPEVIWVLEVENFGPFIVDGDCTGTSLAALAIEKVNPNFAREYAKLGYSGTEAFEGIRERCITPGGWSGCAEKEVSRAYPGLFKSRHWRGAAGGECRDRGHLALVRGRDALDPRVLAPRQGPVWRDTSARRRLLNGPRPTSASTERIRPLQHNGNIGL